MKSEIAGIDLSAKPSGTGCVECLAMGGWWLHLRRCAQCGHVGCCDTSPHQHASKHNAATHHPIIPSFQPGARRLYAPRHTASKHNAATHHPIITSFEPGERWFYDYRSGEFFAGPTLPPPHSHPLDQPTPGPAGRVPANWQTLLHE